MSQENIRPLSPRAWLLAARPKTLTAACIPVIVGTSLAGRDGGFQMTPAVICLLFASLMQIAANFVNDYFDFRKGSDRADRLGPERACAMGWITPKAMLIAIIITLFLACSVGLLLLPFGGWPLIVVGAGCVLFCILYTTLFSYLGLGDLLVILFFGFVPLLGTYYVQTGHLSCTAFWCSLGCGLSIDTLLVVNNYRDREEDKISGKRTLIVTFGEPFGRYLYLALGIFAWLCCIPAAIDGGAAAAICPAFYLVPHFLSWRRLCRLQKGRKLNEVLGETSRNMLLFALLFSLGLQL